MAQGLHKYGNWFKNWHKYIAKSSPMCYIKSVLNYKQGSNAEKNEVKNTVSEYTKHFDEHLHAQELKGTSN